MSFLLRIIVCWMFNLHADEEVVLVVLRRFPPLEDTTSVLCSCRTLRPSQPPLQSNQWYTHVSTKYPCRLHFGGQLNISKTYAKENAQRNDLQYLDEILSHVSKSGPFKHNIYLNAWVCVVCRRKSLI